MRGMYSELVGIIPDTTISSTDIAGRKAENIALITTKLGPCLADSVSQKRYGPFNT